MGDSDKRDFPVTYITSADGKTWSKPAEVPFTVSEHGAQLVSFNGRLFGVVTSSGKNSDHCLYAGRYDKKTGFDLYPVDQKFKAQGRVSVATLGDRMYILYRGTNNGVYLIYSTDGRNWRDLGRIGSKYAETHESPAIHAFAGKKLLLVGVGADQLPYYTITDKDGKREDSWAVVSVNNDKTKGGLALARIYTEDDPKNPYYELALYRLVKGAYFYAYNVFTANDEDHGWREYTQFIARSSAGVAATAYGQKPTLVAFLDYNYHLNSQVVEGYEFSKPQVLAENGSFLSEPGIAYHDGEIVISYVTESHATSAKRKTAVAYEAPAALDEKKALAEADAWSCKWQEQEQREDKTDIKTLIRGCFCL